MEKRKKERHETIEEYFYDKLAKARRCNLDDGTCIEYLITGLEDEDLVRSLSVRDYATPDELLRCMKRLHERVDVIKQTRAKTLHQPPTGQRQNCGLDNNEPTTRAPRKRFNKTGEPLCFNCSTYGHFSAACPKPQRKPRCTNCGKSGHETKDCFHKRNSTNTSDKKATVLIQQGSKTWDCMAPNEKYFMQAILNDKPIKAFVDMGSQFVTLRESESQLMNVTYEPLNHPFTINGFGSGKPTPLGSFQATLTVDQAKANVKVYVVRDAVQVVPLLVGQPFTEQPHVTVVRRKNTLRIFEERDTSDDEDGTLANLKIPVLPPRRVGPWVKEAVVIPPSYVGIIALRSGEETQKTHGDIFIDGSIHESRGHYVPTCVLRKDELGELYIPVTNISATPLIVAEDEQIARGTWCTEEDANTNLDACVNCGERKPTTLIATKDVDIGPSIFDSQKKALVTTINDYRDCFATSLSELGCAKATEMKHVDALSRAPASRPEEMDVAMSVSVFATELSDDDWLVLAQKTDPTLQGILQGSSKTKESQRIKNEYVLAEGKIFKRMKRFTASAESSTESSDDGLSTEAESDTDIVEVKPQQEPAEVLSPRSVPFVEYAKARASRRLQGLLQSLVNCQNHRGNPSRPLTASSSQTSVTPYVVYLPVAPRTLAPFHGESHEDIYDWVQQYERVARHNGWTPEQCRQNAYFALEATARNWFENHEASITSWEQLKAALRRTFTNQQQKKRAEKARIQGLNESVVSFVEDVQRLRNRADSQASEAKKLRILMRGAKKNIFGGLVRAPPITVEGFVTEATNIERALQARASHYQRLPGVAALSPPSCNSPDLREIIRDTVREELRKLLPTDNPPAALSIAEVFREEGQRAYQP
ncbi:hypothetical protein HPB47_027044 [Ixodes persulcatus]|uniref:Uncharacterized protein n=1 Tax=Ixodes persulcatus TaxID=34615 RepID=A0AC60PWZ4_IXOPE|nr:hypothetical protein HPB47_027044 [Ixodes persulcatus]